MRNTASQEPIAFPSEHLLYGGSGYTSGTFIYSNSNHEQLVYLSGDGYYHKSNICTVCDRETSALIYYGALAYLPELSPCRICSSEDIR